MESVDVSGSDDCPVLSICHCLFHSCGCCLQLPSCLAPTRTSPRPEWSGSLLRVTSRASFAITTRSQVSPPPGVDLPGFQGGAHPGLKSLWPSHLPSWVPWCHHHQLLSALQLPLPWFPLPTAPFEDRVTFSNTGITFHSVTRKDTGMYTCMVSDEGGTAYGEVSVQLIVLGMCHESSVQTWNHLLPPMLCRLY